MDTGKPRLRPVSDRDHYRLHLTDRATERFVCFPSQKEAALWLAEQGAGVQAELSLVFGPVCYYCQQAKEA